MKKLLAILLLFLITIFSVAGCVDKEDEKEITDVDPEQTEDTEIVDPTETEKEEKELKLYFNDTEIPVTWENNATVDELIKEASDKDIIVSMSMYGGWEQVGSLGKTYTRNDTKITAVNGDIVLYSGNQIVVFYGSNSWSYTKLGKMNLSEDKVTELLSNGNITLKLSYK